MYANTSGFITVDPVHCLRMEQLVVDYWHVSCKAGARGHYVSLHPRFVFFLDDQKILLSDNKSAKPKECAACFVPAGFEIRSHLNRRAELRHVDVHLSNKQLKSFVGENMILREPFFLDDLHGLSTLVNMIADECEEQARPSELSALFIQTLVSEFLHQVGALSVARIGSRFDLNELQRHVTLNLKERITVDDLARASNMSRSHFNRVFRAETSKSPYQWVLSQRVAHAQKLLRTGTSFVEAADAAGFADQAHFNRVFKAETGCVPSLWINEHRADQNGRNVQDN